VQDVGRLEDGTPYMVMEYLSGQDLKQVVRERGPLPLREAVTYVSQACEAIAEAHSLGIVHRDLKPANLFLTHRSDGTPCVKVLDFGISKDLDPSQKVDANLTKTGMVMGSPMYMSPEQMASIKETDARGDIWSLGVILFQLLTGTVPFMAETIVELVTRVVTRPPPRPTTLRPELPLALEAIILKCLEKQREQRFQSARELMTALQQFLAVDRVSAPTESGPLTGLGTSTEFGLQTSKSWAESTTARRARRIRAPVTGVLGAMGIALLIGGGAWLVWGRSSASNPASVVASEAAPTAAAASLAAPETLGAPAMKGRETDPPKPMIEPVVSAAAPADSNETPVKVKPAVLSASTSRPGGTTPAPKPTKPATPKPSSTSRVPGFDD
jgi:serine/threonine-protein kinase